MRDGSVLLRRRRIDRLFLFILICGILAALVLNVWLHDLLTWFLGAFLPRTISSSLFWLFNAGVLVALLGFGLPKWIGFDARAASARRWKQLEQDKWLLHSRDRDGPWIKCIDYPVVRETALASGMYFFSEWLIIHHGTIIVNPGPSTVDHAGKSLSYDFSVKRTYAWDGCTPKWFFFWFALIGTPDLWHGEQEVATIDAGGRIVKKNMVWQLAHHASLFHDALYQYLDHIPLRRSDVDELFFQMLREAGLWWPVAKLYHICVRWFGPRRDRKVKQVYNGGYRLLTPIPPEGNAGASTRPA